jgi:homopolymeric O-antigen transport system ATP-binding protein
VSDIAISVRDLSKRYEIYNQPHDRLKQSIYPHLQRMVGSAPQSYFREFWALRNVSFDVRRGETVGIVGRNGSGKSTLLQLICGTLTPTGGDIVTNGRIAALLELGSGFNPEFSGRANVHLNAALLGLSPAEIDARFADIAAFADIGPFIEQPVKTYSSGMVVRLAFSVAINVDPDILVVDEALSVGDELFQRKCFARIEAIRRSGATILFVSHSGSTIVELCDQAILIDSGEKLSMGKPRFIVGNYQKLLYAPADKAPGIREAIRSSPGDRIVAAEPTVDAGVAAPAAPEEEKPGDWFDPNLNPQTTLEYESLGARISEPVITTLSNRRVNNLRSGETYRYTYRVTFDRDVHDVRVGMMIKAMNGIELAGVGSGVFGRGIEEVKAGHSMLVSFDFVCRLIPGTYFVNAGCSGRVNGEDVFLHRIIDAAAFRVLAPEPGVLRAGYFDVAVPIDGAVCRMQLSDGAVS